MSNSSVSAYASTSAMSTNPRTSRTSTSSFMGNDCRTSTSSFMGNDSGLYSIKNRHESYDTSLTHMSLDSAASAQVSMFGGQGLRSYSSQQSLKRMSAASNGGESRSGSISYSVIQPNPQQQQTQQQLQLQQTRRILAKQQHQEQSLPSQSGQPPVQLQFNKVFENAALDFSPDANGNRISNGNGSSNYKVNVKLAATPEIDPNTVDVEMTNADGVGAGGSSGNSNSGDTLDGSGDPSFDLFAFINGDFDGEH
ncbi:unnamed protein product [Ambrosiozyma monospora]|uniref:Unnamed protein product n=1 Tax=Ambrosiozyma monospora TaxID=43982 RepID=A0ACB5TTE1_AMBMO|nr:unnamed protein product [Ambrosiozyma monospora]